MDLRASSVTLVIRASSVRVAMTEMRSRLAIGAVQTNELCETYKQCAGGTEVTLCTIPGGGHALYTNPRNFNLAKVAWEMFERQKLP